MLAVDVSTTVPEDWDETLQKGGLESSFYQSSIQARAVACLEGGKTAFFRVYDGEDKTLALLMIELQAPYGGRRVRRNFLLPVASAAHGPVLMAEDRAEEALDALLGRLIPWTRRRASVWIELRGFSPLSRFATDERIAHVFARHGFRRGEWATFVVDLEQSEDVLWSRLHRSARKAIRKCERLGLTVSTTRTYREFHELFWLPYMESEREFGRAVYDLPESYWEISRRHIRYYVAREASRATIAVLGVLEYGGVAKEIGSAIRRCTMERKVPAQDLLHWVALMDSRKRGFHSFDLAGFNPRPASAKEEGIRRFKAKWGGRERSYYTYRRDVLPFVGKVLRLAARLRR